MAIMYGTCHFVSRYWANQYYSPMGYSVKDVKEKITNGEIKIGPPDIKKGESYFINDEGRYIIKTR